MPCKVPFKSAFNNSVCVCIHVASQASAPPRQPSRSPQEAQPTTASPLPATAAAAVDAAGRAAAELAEFQDRQMGDEDDIDPDAPAAIKDSPSVSGDDAAGEQHHQSSSMLIRLELNHYIPSAQASLSGWSWLVLHEIGADWRTTIQIIVVDIIPTVIPIMHAFLSGYRLLDSRSITPLAVYFNKSYSGSDIPVFCDVFVFNNSQAPSCSLDSWPCARIALFNP